DHDTRQFLPCVLLAAISEALYYNTLFEDLKKVLKISLRTLSPLPTPPTSINSLAPEELARRRVLRSLRL
ncbi:MAG: hypothetical protein J7549_15570, partial [Variovorax sp.]|nr:hypothetical protein [Variovorax sp.]